MMPTTMPTTPTQLPMAPFQYYSQTYPPYSYQQQTAPASYSEFQGNVEWDNFNL